MATNKPSNNFQGFDLPTTTPVPDQVFDVLMEDLTGAELKVLLYICRRTFGFKKDSDNISLNQLVSGIKTRDGKILDRGTGLSKDSVSRVVRSLEEKNIIVRNRRQSAERGYEPTTYSLNITPSTKDRLEREREMTLPQHPILITSPCQKIGQGMGVKSDKGLVGKSGKP